MTLPGRISSILICMALLSAPARATFSIVACDAAGTCGGAVATNNLAVGATVIHVRADVGALATQFETNPHYGPRGLALLANSTTPSGVIERLLAQDGHFDGTGIDERQVGVVDPQGAAATYTGAQAASAAWAGARQGPGYAIQGNGLASEEVVQAMEQAFQSTPGALAERLMASLAAGQAAGGQTIGELSAALLVRTRSGGWNDVDLRVDAGADPVRELRRLLDMRRSHQTILRAERLAATGHPDEARATLEEALQQAGDWDRIWRRAARLSMRLGDTEKARACLAGLRRANPVWAALEYEDPLYDGLRHRPDTEAPASSQR